MRCSDCKRYKTKQCYINPSGKDLESAEYLTCFEPKEETKEAPVAEIEKTEVTRSVKHKGTGKKILLAIAAIAVGTLVQVLGTILLKVTGLDRLLPFQVFNTLAGFAVMGFCIYYWVFRVEKGKLDEVPQGTKTAKEGRKKPNKLVWQIPLLVVIIVIAILVWRYPDWFTSNSHIPSSLPSSQLKPMSEPEQPKPSSGLSHFFPITDVVEDPKYWNADWDALELYQMLHFINNSYYKEHTYIKGVFDCNDMAVDLWHILHKQGITSIIVVGNLYVERESFAECDHAWLLIINKDPGYRIFIIEPTNGETYVLDPRTGAFAQYIQGYCYSSPSDLRADNRKRL